MHIITSPGLSALHRPPNAKVRLPWRLPQSDGTPWPILPPLCFICGPLLMTFPFLRSCHLSLPLFPLISWSHLLCDVCISFPASQDLFPLEVNESPVVFSVFTLKQVISPVVTTTWEAIFRATEGTGLMWHSGRELMEDHSLTNGNTWCGPQTIECQHKVDGRGANLLKVHEDRERWWGRHEGWWNQEKPGQLYMCTDRP